MMMSGFPRIPVPEPLRGRETGTFTHDSVVIRLPEIGRQMLRDNDFSPAVAAEVEALLEQIPAGRIRPLAEKGVLDAAEWAGYVAPYIGQDWLQVPWFFVETYFYRRILEATGYFAPGLGQGNDPFLFQKEQGLEVARPAIRILAEQTKPLLAGAIPDHEALITLLAADLWGNQVDLSLWPVGSDEKPDHTNSAQRQAHTLVDDSQAISEYLLGRPSPARRIDIILDNAGFELVTDLFLAAYVLERGISEAVYLQAKPHPYFVSDAMIKDVRQTVNFLAVDDHPDVVTVAQLLWRMLEEGRLRLVEDYFWTSALEMWLMPGPLRAELSESEMIISKGDANYRRLLGDRHWPPTTNFADVVSYSPAPLAALRTQKSEVAAGLEPGQAETVAGQDSEWLINGRWGVIQFWDGT
jgi:uncharacterized protein with ATP-grasp and redox domains